MANRLDNIGPLLTSPSKIAFDIIDFETELNATSRSSIHAERKIMGISKRGLRTDVQLRRSVHQLYLPSGILDQFHAERLYIEFSRNINVIYKRLDEQPQTLSPTYLLPVLSLPLYRSCSFP